MDDDHYIPISVKNGYKFIISSMVRLAAKTGLHPNVFTLVSLVPAIGAGFAAGIGAFKIAAVLFIISGAFDLIDGALARQTHQITKLGMLLDSTIDRLSDAAIPLGLIAFYAPYSKIAVIPGLCLLSGYTISYIRARAEGIDIALPRLWMRREDRFVIIVIALLLAPMSVPGTTLPNAATLIVIGLLTVTGSIAAVQAMLSAAKRSE
ncbi:MAG: CDP-alcohol phosphatidyltransferase family protein [Fimbriimonadaceae bacterium]|nr:CDP-alcohol phosphatidyltransferase family protein [Alphaproteobacteria bacterium]